VLDTLDAFTKQMLLHSTYSHGTQQMSGGWIQQVKIDVQYFTGIDRMLQYKEEFSFDLKNSHGKDVNNRMQCKHSDPRT
jgi:hypothetical protein